MDDKNNGQVNLYVYDPEKLECYVGRVAEQLCKKIDYPLHVRRIFSPEDNKAWDDFMFHMAIHNIPSINEEGDNKKTPVFSVVLVQYKSLCSSRTPESACTWYKWFTMTEPQEICQLDDNLIRKLVEVCDTISKKSLRYPPVIISGFSRNSYEKERLNRKLNSCGIPDYGAIYLDKNDKSKSVEGLEFLINYFIQTFWLPPGLDTKMSTMNQLTDEINAKARQ